MCYALYVPYSSRLPAGVKSSGQQNFGRYSPLARRSFAPFRSVYLPSVRAVTAIEELCHGSWYKKMYVCSTAVSFK